MPTRTIYLTKSRTSRSQRAHFAIFVPSPSNPSKGTLINAVGAPMAGYMLEFKRNDCPATTQQGHCEFFPIGEVDTSHIVDDAADDEVATSSSSDSEPRGDLEMAAARVRTPGVSENFMAPVNDVTNKRCQEWTMEYVRYLVEKGYIGAEAVDIVQSQRDPPTHGIGLRAVDHI